MRRTALAIALSTGALAIPAVALAQGGNDTAPSTAPVQQQEQQQPEQDRQQQPRDHDCPEGQERGGGDNGDTAL